MANPAELLHAQLDAWQSTKNQSTARGIGDGGKAAAWTEQRNAARNLENLLQLIDEFEKQNKPVEIERGYVPQWIQAVYAHPHGWSASQSGHALTKKEPLNALRSFGYRIDETLLPIAPGAKEDMLKAVAEAESLNSEELPQSLRLLLHESTSFLRKAIKEYDITGEFVLNTAVKKFIQALELLKEHNPEANLADRVAARAARWYKKPPFRLVVEGFVSAQMMLAAPEINAAIEQSALSGIEALMQVPELPALESGTEDQSESRPEAESE